MTFPRTITDKAVQYPGRYQLTLVAGTTDTYDLVAVPGTVTAAGTAINKSYLDPIENELSLLKQRAKISEDNGTAISIPEGYDLNLVFDTGFYEGSNLVNAPIASGWLYVEVTQHVNKGGYALQIAYPLSSVLKDCYIRQALSNVWTAWAKLNNYTASDVLTKIKTVDGSGSGLDADLVRGLTFRLSSGVLQYSTDSGGTWNNVGGVKSVQRGSATITSDSAGVTNMPLNITISAVSAVNKASVNLLNIISDANTTSYRGIDVRADLTTTSNLQITGNLFYSGSSDSRTIEWEVTEYY